MHTLQSPAAVKGHAESPAGAQWRTHCWGCAKDWPVPALSSDCHTRYTRTGAMDQGYGSECFSQDPKDALPDEAGTHETIYAHVST